MANQNPAGTAARKRAFCRWYAVLGNPYEAAVRAGYPPQEAADAAVRLLSQPVCRQYLAAAGTPPVPVRQLVLAGLTRLAFGRTNDAVQLAFAEELPDEDRLNALDLYAVSEIRRDKNGGVEVKLFDRQRALERLLECASAADSQAAAAAVLSAFGCAGEEAEHDTGSDAGAVFGEAADCDELVASAEDPTA
ncbi:MAG: terminase small subunit [Oscillospiraceae bacterium]|nr:terminase small subunit [Oscillospiraceae bacterium]